MKAKCPYCGRKITYGTRFMERLQGEHVCKNCKKPSNVVQDKGIWMLFTLCSIFSLLVFLFYFGFADIFQKAYDTNGDFSLMITLFFGKAKTVKWIFWELLPYLVFFFVSPVYVQYQMQKKYAYTSADKIDLGTDFIPPLDTADIDNNGSTRVIPKVGSTKVSDDHVFEDISSNSGKSLGDTKNFKLNMEEMTQVRAEDYVKTASYRSDAPLKKVERVPVRVAQETQELYRVKLLREQERQKREIQEKAKSIDKAKEEKNYSANRKF